MYFERFRSHHDSKGFIEKSIEKFIEKERTSEGEFISFLENNEGNNTGGIYFHVPYCDRICTFCNLNRSPIDSKFSDYTNFLISEIDRYSNYKYIKTSKFDCIYFGGGTPTILDEKNLKKLLEKINHSFNLSEDIEFTFETTIHNLTESKIKIFNDYGVNRISVGIQTFNNSGRKVFGRMYDKDSAIEKLNNIKDKFNGLTCIDIIYNYPNQTIKELFEDIKIIKENDIDSISFYSLMIQEGSKLDEMIKNKVIDYDNKLKKDFCLHTLFLDELFKEDYSLIELTKITKENRDRYNYIKNNYSNNNLLPIGKGAGGRIEDYGIYNINEKMKVVSKISSVKDELNEYLGYFQYTGFSEKYFIGKLDKNTFNLFKEKLNLFIKDEYLYFKNGKYYYTNKGIFWGNNIAVDLLDIIIKNKYSKFVGGKA